MALFLSRTSYTNGENFVKNGFPINFHTLALA